MTCGGAYWSNDSGVTCNLSSVAGVTLARHEATKWGNSAGGTARKLSPIDAICNPLAPDDTFTPTAMPARHATTRAAAPRIVATRGPKPSGLVARGMNEGGGRARNLELRC